MNGNIGQLGAQTKNTQIPPTFSRFFWDVDLSKIHTNTHASYIIERLMIWGNEEAWNWAHHTYSVQQIQEVIKTSKTLDAKTAVFLHTSTTSLKMRCNVCGGNLSSNASRFGSASIAT